MQRSLHHLSDQMGCKFTFPSQRGRRLGLPRLEEFGIFLCLMLVLAVRGRDLVGSLLINVGVVHFARQIVSFHNPIWAPHGQATVLVPSSVSYARQAFTAARALNDHDSRAVAWLGKVDLAVGDFTNANLYLRRAVELDPANEMTWLAAGTAAFQEDRQSEAIRFWRQMPRSGSALTFIGDNLAGQDRCDSAVSLYRAAIEISPQYPNAHVGLGDCLLTLDRPSEAIAPYQTALNLGLGSAVVANRLGKVLVSQGRTQEAIPYLEGAVKWHPYPWYIADLAYAYAGLGQIDKADEWMRKMEQLFPTSGAAYFLVGEYYLNVRSMPLVASQKYEIAIGLQPDAPYYFWEHLAVAYSAAGLPDKAGEMFAEAAKRKSLPPNSSK